MNVLTILAGLVVTLITALPTLEARLAAPGIDYFYLQSQVYGNNADSGTNKSGQYVFSYHTGAGLGIAAEESNHPGMVAYLNGSLLSFTYNGSYGPWPAAIAFEPYRSKPFMVQISENIDTGAAFNEISISIARRIPPSDGFYFNETGLQHNQTDGWLACDWWYATPQVFAIVPGYSARTLPTSCSKIRLFSRPATLSKRKRAHS